MTYRDLAPPALLATALLVWASGALDRPGFEGVGQGLALGAAVSAPIWAWGVWRRRR